MSESNADSLPSELKAWDELSDEALAELEIDDDWDSLSLEEKVERLKRILDCIVLPRLPSGLVPESPEPP